MEPPPTINQPLKDSRSSMSAKMVAQIGSKA